jgi:uncharacterized protein
MIFWLASGVIQIEENIMIADIIPMKTTGRGAPKPKKGKPDPAKLVSGTWANKTWSHWEGEDNRLYCGIWECEPGMVHMEYEEWEFCHFISGVAVLHKHGSKKSWRFKKGDAFIIPAGFKGTWETVKKVKKHYVILMPKA